MQDRLLCILRFIDLFRPILTPTTLSGVESIAEAITRLQGHPNDMRLIVRRRVAEAVLRGANNRVWTTKLRFYLEVRMAMSAGAGFGALEAVKAEEKAAREQQAEKVTAEVV